LGDADDRPGKTGRASDEGSEGGFKEEVLKRSRRLKTLFGYLPRLHGGQGDGVEDVFDGGSATEVVDGFAEALEHRTHGDDVGGALDGFVGGVAGVEVGEDEDVGATGDGAVRGFGPGDFADAGGVVLKGAVDDERRVAAADDIGGLGDFIDVAAGTRAVGRVADHGDDGFDAEGFRGVGALDRDVGEEFGIGVRVHGTVAVNEDLVGKAHEEDRGDGAGVGVGFDQLERGADGVGGALDGPGNKSVHFVEREHDGAKHGVVTQAFDGVLFGHTLAAAAF